MRFISAVAFLFCFAFIATVYLFACMHIWQSTPSEGSIWPNVYKASCEILGFEYHLHYIQDL